MSAIAPASTATELDRGGLTEAVDAAARLVHPVWPISRFIAVNPLGGVEEHTFEDAAGMAEAAFGARVTLSEDRFRDCYAAGRITSADLDRALRRRLRAAASNDLMVAGARRSALELLRADLLHGATATAPPRTLHTPAELVDPSLADLVDGLVARWCAVYLDRGQSGWSMPGREHGLYAAWRSLAIHDRSVSSAVRRELKTLPDRADDAVLQALAELGIPSDSVVDLLEAELTRLPGWAGHLRWRSEHEGGSGLMDLLAIRLGYEVALLHERGGSASGVYAAPRAPGQPVAEPGARAWRARQVLNALGLGRVDRHVIEEVAVTLDALPERDRRWVWLDAFEEHQRRALLGSLQPADAQQQVADRSRPDAQLVCCIDTRSEGLRRHLEAIGAYETFGFAGFFAVAMRFHDLAGSAPTDNCPVLLTPAHDIVEQPAEGAERAAERSRVVRESAHDAHHGAHAAKQDVAAPFALAEATGWFSGPLAAVRTLAAGPFGRARTRARALAAPPVATELQVDEQLSLADRVATADATLRAIGLVDGFAPIVLLCGHHSATENNPYGAALACGACGGHGGGPNARAAAAILNAADVREHLRRAGIDIPSDTWFVPAAHDTTTDVVEILDEHLVPASHEAALAAVREDLRQAGLRLSNERVATLPGSRRGGAPSRASEEVHTRSSDWAQVYPEWGLAGNAAIVIGPRSITEGVDLGRRAFLHSYDAALDPTGSILESILTAPLVVAQWINAQYYFSSVDPEQFGSGTKTIHNAVGGIGVLAGGSGDLRRGLPWQSVGEGRRLVHEPVRLLAVVQAPTAVIDEIVARTPLLQQLLGNGWIAMAARGDDHSPWMRRARDGWQPWMLDGDAEVAA